MATTTATDAFAQFVILRSMPSMTTYAWRGWELDVWDGWHSVLLSPYEPAMRFADTPEELAEYAAEQEAQR